LQTSCNWRSLDAPPVGRTAAVTCRILPAVLLGTLISFLPLAAASPDGNANSMSGRVAGVVQDATGARVAGARVRLWQPGTALELVARTDPAGSFEFSRLLPGDYRLSVSAEGFSMRLESLRLAGNEPRLLEIQLEVLPVVQEIVVQAAQITGPPENLLRIPGSLEVLDERTLESSRVFTFTEALRKVSGLHVRDEEGFGLRPNIGVRGLNPTRSTKVLLLEDGIPLAFAPYGDNASYYHPPVDRFESIEVLKGSGQVLYGPATVGAVINYVTPPVPAARSGSVSLLGGSRDYFNGHARAGFPLGRVGLLFDFLRKQGRGSRENVRSGLDDFNFKAVATLSPRQAWTFRANYFGEDSQVTYSGLTEAEYRESPRQNPFRNDHFYGDRWGLSATQHYLFSPQFTLRTNLYASLFDRRWWRQSSNSGQRPNRAADPACGGMENLNTTCGNEGRLRKYYTWGVEPRAQANFHLFGWKHEADFGARLHSERQERRQENGASPVARTGVLVENNERRNTAWSGFLQDRWVFGRLVLTPGLRLEHIRYQRTNRLARGGAGITGGTELTQWIPGLGFSFNPADRLTIFGGVHRGFSPPRTEDIINNATGGTVDLDPELSWNYELGVRSSPARGLRLEATFFRMDYENQVVPASVAGGLGAAFTNGGETLHQGFEFAARADSAPLAGTRHNFYARVAYTWIPVAEFRGLRFSNVPGFSSVSVSGNRLPYAPENLLNFTAGYSHPRGIDLLFEGVRVGAQFADDLNSVAPSPDGQRGLLPASTVWNLTLNYSLESIHAVFFISGKNIFDTTYIADRSRGILPGTPRLVQAGFKYRF
jgi:Fe(3+) dicitrate transport protein